MWYSFKCVYIMLQHFDHMEKKNWKPSEDCLYYADSPRSINKNNNLTPKTKMNNKVSSLIFTSDCSLLQFSILLMHVNNILMCII